jgi:ribulose-5-phosphate 4-epimerase/fuculose-1-phosphate aldolase
MMTTLLSSAADARRQCSDVEWETRVNLAACYRLMPLYGMSDLVYNHITARIPDSDEEFLINPYGMLYEEITASSLIKINLEGDVLENSGAHYGVNRAGYVIHSAVHATRKDVQCVIHTHTRAGMAVSAMRVGLLPVTQTAMRFHDIAYHDYEGVALDLAERERLARDLGARDAMILCNHGLLAASASIAEAFNVIYWLEMACRAQVDAMAAGTPLIIPSDEVVEKTCRVYQSGRIRRFGVMEWPAMLRLLDRRSPGYEQ